MNIKNFKSPDGTTKRVALLSGHTYLIGTKWQMIPEFAWSACYAAGCASEEMFNAVDRGETLASLVNHNTMTSNVNEQLQDLFTSWIENNEEEHFDSRGVPKLAHVKAAIGPFITKNTMLFAWETLEK
jgi:hypothetical protein